MKSAATQPVTLTVGNDLRVSALLERPANARALFVMGPGAGAGMRHAFLSDVSAALATRGIASLRYQFPYMERDSRRPDSPAICHATVRAASAWAGESEPTLQLIAGGKSFGGRMTSQAQALDPLAGVRGLAFLGFPLHPPKKPSLTRAEHLSKIHIPMLFVQGTRDVLAETELMRHAVEGLGDRARIRWMEGADHAFHVPARSGKSDADVLGEIADALEAWVESVIR
ncbi:MAG: alpha/beta family hydrolase [Steroidobacteraceae bacterium]